MSRRGKARRRGADYRAYAIGHDGHFSDCQARACDEDRDAIQWAGQLIAGYAIELWWGERYVAGLAPRPEH